MTPSNSVIVGPSPLTLLGTLVFASLVLTASLAAFLLSLSLAVFGLGWFLSTGWVIVIVTGVLVACCCGALLSVAIIGRRPRVEIGPDGFIACTLFGSRSRRWSDIEGLFAVIKVGLQKGVGYHLSQDFKESACIKPTTLFAGNDEVISGAYEMPTGDLAALLNQHKTRAADSA